MCANSNHGSSVAPSTQIYAHYIYHSLSALKHVHALFQQSFFPLSLLHYWCKSITLAWHRDRGGLKEVQGKPCSWLKTCSSTQPIVMQGNHFKFHKPHMCAQIQHTFIRSCQNCDQNWYSSCVSRALGEVFLMEKSTNLTLKQNTVGGSEKGENTSLHP